MLSTNDTAATVTVSLGDVRRGGEDGGQRTAKTCDRAAHWACDDCEICRKKWIEEWLLGRERRGPMVGGVSIVRPAAARWPF